MTGCRRLANRIEELGVLAACLELLSVGGMEGMGGMVDMGMAADDHVSSRRDRDRVCGEWRRAWGAGFGYNV